MVAVHRLCLALALVAAVAATQVPGTAAQGYKWVTYTFTQPLSHFEFGPYNPTIGNGTFEQRYLVNNTWYKPGGPVFFYTGNEGPIELFADNTGFMWDIAPKFNALLVFGEHRYYGASKPFGNDTFKDPKSGRLQYLSSEQALADYARLLPHVQQQYNAVDSPVISFGGSYGGMLAAWFRIRYPWITAGSIAASAPVLQFTGLTGPKTWNAIITNTFTNASQLCADSISKSWDLIKAMSVSELNSMFTPCKPLTSQDQYMEVFQWLTGAIDYMTMADYPYPASFLGPMPGWPVKAACNFFNKYDTVEAMREVGNLFYNYTGQAGQCFELSQNGPSTLQDPGGWDYQSCTEMVMPIGQYGEPTDMFYPAPWNLEAALDSCEATYGFRPRPTWIQTSYGGKDLNGASNIVFSNGDLDPWSSGGVHFNVTDNGIFAILIKNGAHHLDLRAANPLDPESVILARDFHQANIRKWIAEFVSRHAVGSGHFGDL